MVPFPPLTMHNTLCEPQRNPDGFPSLPLCLHWQVYPIWSYLCWIMPFQGRWKWGNWFWLETKSKSNFATAPPPAVQKANNAPRSAEGKSRITKNLDHHLPIRFSSASAVKSQSKITHHPLKPNTRELRGFPNICLFRSKPDSGGKVQSPDTGGVACNMIGWLLF